MVRDFFKPEDFNECNSDPSRYPTKKEIAERANKVLSKLIESGELKYESSKQSGEDTGENKEIKNRMPRMVRIETWEW